MSQGCCGACCDTSERSVSFVNMLSFSNTGGITGFSSICRRDTTTMSVHSAHGIPGIARGAPWLGHRVEGAMHGVCLGRGAEWRVRCVGCVLAGALSEGCDAWGVSWLGR